ncbi:MAG TPA: hypothetical protein VGP61_10160, partial [Gemmatimonadales bacterium]|nr:hypothetical protein [Gemmatimonadales bacterium]
SSKLVLSVLGALSGDSRTGAPSKRPTMLHDFFWQAVLAWIGRGGEYSEGSAFSARKPLAAEPRRP